MTRPRAHPAVAGQADGLPASRERAGTGSGVGRDSLNDRLAEVGRGSTVNLAGAVVAAVSAVAVTVGVTRAFSKPVAGAFFTAISAFLIVEAIASLGANTGLVYFIARLRSLGRENLIPAILRVAIVPVALVSLAAVVVMQLFAGPLAHIMLSGHLSHGQVSEGAVVNALRGLALAVPFAALLDAFLGATRGYRDMQPTVVVDKIGRSSGQVIAILLAAAMSNAILLAPLWALPYLPASAAAWFWLRRIRRRRAPRRLTLPDVPAELAALLALATPVAPSHLRRSNGAPAGGQATGRRMERRQLASASPRSFWRFTAPRAVASLAQVTLQRIDIVLVAIMRGPVAAAVYTAATRFLVLGQLGGMAISSAAQPRFTELFAAGDRRGANVIYRATTAWLVLMVWPLYLLAVIYGPLVLAVFGRSYNAGHIVMVILGLAMLLATVCGQVDMVLITSGRSGWSLTNGLLAVGVNVGVDLALIPRYGITGAAIGWAVAIAVSNLMPLAQLATVLRLHPFGRGTLIAVITTALSFGVIPLTIRGLLGGGVLPLAVAVAAGCAVQATLMWRFRGPLRLSSMPALSVIKTLRTRAQAR